MRRVSKIDTSKIIKDNLNYIEGNASNNSKISKILYKEQKGFCAYTEEYISRADAKDIEHFNPTLKGKKGDSYKNWFLVKHQWNKEKSSKWAKYQPILLPTDELFESRVIYDQGDYRINDSEDIEANNLINLLKLDDIILADERKKYLKRKKEEIEKFGVDPKAFFEILIEDDIKQISYLRAIKEEFKINIWEMLPKIR
tara:strand:+ start:35827 stop:36423 length:597 start_codon:yes stop_codon:yes gene_type:complete